MVTVQQQAVRPLLVPGFSQLVRRDTDSVLWPLAGIALVLTLQLALVFDRAINWDEFYHYTEVHRFSEGHTKQSLQTFYVQLFQWLLRLSGSDIDHIVAARTVMFGCEVIAAAATALLAARFSNRTIGLLCALCYLSAGFVLQHGFSFRVDPIAAALLMSSLCILTFTRLSAVSIAILGALVGLAGMITIKIVLYAPVFLGLAWFRWHEHGYRSSFLLRLIAGGVIAIGIFGAIFAYHWQGLEAPTPGSGGTVLRQSATKMFQIGVPFYWIFIVKAALLAPLFTILVLLAPYAIKRSNRSGPEKIAICAFILPITVLAFYHNTAPYFYTFILPPVAVACALPMAMAVRRYNVAIAAAAFTGCAAILWVTEDRGIIDRQRELVHAADTIFPERIAYFDFCGMLARHSKANVFMTPWGSELYRNGKGPTMQEVMQKRVVPLVVENDPMFTRLLRSSQPTPEFLAEDAAVLRRTYLPYWGPFWVAGAIIPGEAGQRRVEIRVPGPYTLSGGAIAIGGKTLSADDVIHLNRGSHLVTAIGGKAARLTWGNHLPKPVKAPPPEPHWTWF